MRIYRGNRATIALGVGVIAVSILVLTSVSDVPPVVQLAFVVALFGSCFATVYLLRFRVLIEAGRVEVRGLLRTRAFTAGSAAVREFTTTAAAGPEVRTLVVEDDQGRKMNIPLTSFRASDREAAEAEIRQALRRS